MKSKARILLLFSGYAHNHARAMRIAHTPVTQAGPRPFNAAGTQQQNHASRARVLR
jgi:hypothetical protein